MMHIYVFLLHGLPVLVVSSNTPRRCINLSLFHLHGDWKQYVLFVLCLDLLAPMSWASVYYGFNSPTVCPSFDAISALMSVSLFSHFLCLSDFSSSVHRFWLLEENSIFLWSQSSSHNLRLITGYIAWLVIATNACWQSSGILELLHIPLDDLFTRCKQFTSFLPREDRNRRRARWNVRGMGKHFRYFPNLHFRLNLGDVNREDNILMMASVFHEDFGKFRFVLEATTVPNRYRLRKFPIH